MATEICLLIQDDGAMFVSTEDVPPEMMEEEGAEEAKGTPVGSLDEALAAIKEMAAAASMAPPAGDVELPAEPAGEEPPAPADEEEAAMAQSFGGRA